MKVIGTKLPSLLKDILCDLIGSLFYAMGIYTFAKTANFSPGGISGLALIINHLWKFPIGAASLALNIPLIILSYRVVGKQFLLKTARTMIITSIFLDIIFPYTPAYTGNPLLAALYSGLCLGVGMAFFYMRGSSSGGMDFLIMTIKVTHPHFSFGMVTMISDFFNYSYGMACIWKRRCHIIRSDFFLFLFHYAGQSSVWHRLRKTSDYYYHPWAIYR